MRRDRFARVEALELAAGLHGPLTPAERHELARLDRELAARPPPAEWDYDRMRAFLHSGGDPAGTARRHDELRRRNRTSEQMLRDLAHDAMISAMTLHELNAYGLARSRSAGEPGTGGDPP